MQFNIAISKAVDNGRKTYYSYYMRVKKITFIYYLIFKFQDSDRSDLK